MSCNEQRFPLNPAGWDFEYAVRQIAEEGELMEKVEEGGWQNGEKRVSSVSPGFINLGASFVSLCKTLKISLLVVFLVGLLRVLPLFVKQKSW